MKQEIFFAYASGDQQIGDAIRRAVDDFNKHQNSWAAITWEGLFINGRPISKVILARIRESDVFACDLSHLNENVLFELGYAIGQGKKVLIFLNANSSGAAHNYKAFRALKGVGYSSYKNAKDIQGILSNQRTESAYVFVTEIAQKGRILPTADALLITSGQQDQAAVQLTELLAQTDFKIISDDAYEVEYQPRDWYIRSIYEAQTVIVHNPPADTSGSRNQVGAFFGGLALGLDRELLFVAPAPREAPIDYEDLLVEYQSADECALKTIDWLQDRIGKKGRVPAGRTQDINLIKLGIGCETAEDEREDLIRYFVEVDPYARAKERKISLIVGRKGSGKTAIFIKLAHDFSEEENTYTVVLKPDSDELVQHSELSSRFESESNRRGFFHSVWRFVILSKLMIAVETRIKLKPRAAHQFAESEARVIAFVSKNRELLALNFYGAMRRFADRIGGSITPQSMEGLYRDYLAEAISLLKDHFGNAPYAAVRILADNLDKSWDAKSDLEIQSEMILRLLEYGDRIVRELHLDDVKGLKYNCVVLLRRDIFDFIRRKSREPDKLTTAMLEIDWSRTPKLLRLVVERRIRVLLSLPDHDDLRDIWKLYFGRDESNPDPISQVLQAVVPRPRDVIYFFGKVFESAANNGRSRVDLADWQYAAEVYGTFLRQSIFAEVKAEHPGVEILLAVADELTDSGGRVEYARLKVGCARSGLSEVDILAVLDALFKRDYLTGAFGETALSDLPALRRALDQTHFWTRKKLLLRFGKVSPANRD